MCDLLKINVNEHTEKKGGLTYLSWAWAWSEVLKIDPNARWRAVEYGDERGCTLPAMFFPDGSAMVKTEVIIKGETKVCTLPVMDHKNKAIKQPDSFAINTAIMRCMTKAISMHGLGLYIYAGEDLPEGDDTSRVEWLAARKAEIFGAKNVGELRQFVADAIKKETEQKDSDAIDQISAWSEEKKQEAQPKAVA